MSDEFVLHWDQHGQSRTSSLKSLWENQDFLDVTIACDDDQIDAHKVILSAASPLLRNILKRNPHTHPLLYLRGTAKKDIEALLNFIYSGVAHIPEEGVGSFIALGSSLQVEGLSEESPHIIFQELFKKSEESRKETEMKKKKRGKLPVEKVMEHAHAQEVKKARGESTEQTSDKIGEKNNEMIVHRKQRVLSEEPVEFTEDTLDDIVTRYLEPSGGENEENGETLLNTSLIEYDEKVAELMLKTESGWKCRECPYEKSSSGRGHMREHVEMHITGFSLSCQNCDKTFSQKRKIRHHQRKHHVNHSE